MSSASVFTGPWVNHSHGFLIGATITLKNRDAGFLLAVLVVVVGGTGRAFWSIASYIIHQLRCNEIPHDALFYQQQAILKNSTGALGAAWKFARVSFGWRNHERSRWWQVWESRTLRYILAALLVAVAFGAASIFTAQVTKSVDPEFLIHSPDCGFWGFPSSEDTSWQLKILNDSISAAAYARACYGNNETTASQCTSYKTSQIPWISNKNASCPFAAGTCLMGPTAAYQMDTGPMDSHIVLGLNAKDSDRVTLRKVATCAPITTKPFAEIVNITYDTAGDVDKYILYNMGPIEGSATYTYSYNTHTSLTNVGYNLVAENSLAGEVDAWEPIAEFNKTDADVSMYFLSANSVGYSYPNSDPMFSANIETNISYPSGPGGANLTLVYYFPDYWVNVVGCTDQYQICNPAIVGPDGEATLCTPLGPLGALPSAILHIGLSNYQTETCATLVVSMRSASLFYAVNGRGSSALQTSETVFQSAAQFQVAQIPNNRWQTELGGWFDISLVTLQQALVEKASGPANIVNQGGTITSPGPTDFIDQKLCKSQMIRNVSGYQNFSTLGVALILIIGTSLVILGWTIDMVVGFVQRYLFKRNLARLSWVSDGFLQLQRMAYEGAGYSDWRCCADYVPVSSDLDKASQRLGPLNIDDLDHPQLTRSATAPTGDSSPTQGKTPYVAVKDEGSRQEEYPMLGWQAGNT
ncbi:hypothetical protein N431DRAFT_354454 [Stipitochalara longipes BDJ]|nr:hypothetical protein N431DRAFT_354454 [Stipitochalara longipes BDJ]